MGHPEKADMNLPVEHAWIWAMGACVAAAMFEGLTAGTAVKSRLQELRQPKFGPRLWVWTVIGAAYYVLFFLLLNSLLNRPSVPPWTGVALTLTGALLIANGSWNWLFFRRKNLWWSFLFFIPYLVVALALAVVLHWMGNPILRLYLLYLCYLMYASWWGYSVWRLNGEEGNEIAGIEI
jgi:tryptophan-rich sensory protein